MLIGAAKPAITLIVLGATSFSLHILRKWDLGVCTGRGL